MKAAIRDNDPVFVMENTLLYGEKWDVPEEEYVVELGVANILKEGTRHDPRFSRALCDALTKCG